ncbi:glycosyltransferase family 4 protein [Anaerosalibacter bizertensis]|uniref:glycosyltransferase family 4 protein n=1 Tax=Anaerosalibacter bizertensis TaxID=932217 RepID=UPI001C0EFD55|nr:glycosyltransferase family 4 protein [Anaerosalibacter bizertensis]MBU5294098.1 glycosyltransferase family 4 protein [Anaerosalibacter bizertensis]
MKKILFISNISNRITNFAIPSIVAGQSLGYDFHMAANYSNFTDDASKYNLTIHHIDIKRNPFNIKNIKAYKQMLDLIKKEEFDVIHCNTPIGGVLGRICGAKAGVKKIIYTAHGFHFYKGAPLINNTLYKWVEMYLAKKTDAIITINKEDYEAAKHMKLRNNGNVYYVPGVGIDVDAIKKVEVDRTKKRAEFGINDNEFVITAVGRLEKNKNVENMISAIAKANDNVILLLCGKGEQAGDMKDLAKQLNVEDRVIFAGFRDDIPKILKSSDAYMLISYREGLSRSLMEAMASGLPCIASKIRGNVDLIEDGIGGYLVNPNDVDEIAGSINKIADDIDLKNKMGQVNLKNIKSCSIENVKKQMKEIYKGILY